MSPPSYSDLGKSARDVFGKGFHFGLVKLDVKSKTGSGAQVSGGGVSNVDSGKVTGNVEYKTKRCPGTGMQVTTKFSNDNVLNSSLDLQVINHSFYIDH